MAGYVPPEVIKKCAEVGNTILSASEREELIEESLIVVKTSGISLQKFLYDYFNENNTLHSLVLCCVVADALNVPLLIEKYPELDTCDENL